MIFAIDIGNTNINFGIFQDKKLMKKFSISTNEIKKAQKFYINQDFKLFSMEIDEIIICSVVPGVTKLLKKFLEQNLSLSYRIAGEDIIVPIENLYSRPNQVGQDRLINAFAVNRLYKVPALIIDFGTAVTFDVVNPKGAYEGGIIFPGIDISLNALFEKAALLFPVKLEKPEQLVGKDTASSIKSGVVHGYTKMVEGLIDSFKNSIDNEIFIVATGGNLVLLKEFLKKIDIFDLDLTLKGLNLLKTKENKVK